jgi:hypothetical protein
MSTNVGLIDRLIDHVARIAIGLLLRSRVRAAFCPTAGTESAGSSRSLRRSEAAGLDGVRRGHAEHVHR